MAFDPQREDYQRMGLRFARSLDSLSPSEAQRAFNSFSRRFARDRDSLPQSDSDRAFHLVSMAAKLIDYELPFADDEEGPNIIERGRSLLDEATSLDPLCFDAIRMKAAADCPSFESFLAYLNDRSEEVRRSCQEQQARALEKGDDERAALEANIALRPYLRWLSTQAEQALICGRNKQSIEFAQKAFETDLHDSADVRFTAALAYAKIEDEQGLEALAKGRHGLQFARRPNDAWLQLARIALAHKQRDFGVAEQILDDMTHLYPHVEESLIRQIELPDGVFARLAVKPYSEDELVLAISESTVLLQEGREPNGRGVLGAWITEQAAKRLPQAVLSLLAAEKRLYQQGGQR